MNPLATKLINAAPAAAVVGGAATAASVAGYRSGAALVRNEALRDSGDRSHPIYRSDGTTYYVVAGSRANTYAVLGGCAAAIGGAAGFLGLARSWESVVLRSAGAHAAPSTMRRISSVPGLAVAALGAAAFGGGTAFASGAFAAHSAFENAGTYR